MLFTNEHAALELVPCEGADCTAKIWWGRKFSKRHPYNPDGSSHFDNCPNADAFRAKPRRKRTQKKQTEGKLAHMSQKKIKWLARLGDLDSEQRDRWRTKQNGFKHQKVVNWDKITLHPIKAQACLKRLVRELEAEGAPFQNGVPTAEAHILACTIGQVDRTGAEQDTLGIVVKEWLYRELYAYIYSTVRSDKEDLRLSVADYIIKPQSEVPARMWDAYLETL